MEKQWIDKAAIVSPPIQVTPGYVAQQPPPPNNQIQVQTDFTTPPPTNAYGMWLQPMTNSWQTQFCMPSPVPQANATVTSTTTSYNNPPTFRSSSNSNNSKNYRSPLARWRSSNNSRAHQQTSYHYGNNGRNSYPRQLTQNANRKFYANSPRYPQIPSSSPTQNWSQSNQRPPSKQHMRMNRPSSYNHNQINRTYQETNAGIECKTRKRKLKSQLSGEPQHVQKPWNREDAVKAIAAEMKFRRLKGNKQIMIRFPDHEVTRQIVQNFHTGIKSVHFRTPCLPRYCYVQVQPSANIENVAKALRETFFQHEKLKVEIKDSQVAEKTLPENIDPYTLYLGNLPTTISSKCIKDAFPNARVEIGFVKKFTFTRYAFIKFSNAEDAIQTYIEKHNLILDGRSVMLRFRRTTKNVIPPEQVDKLKNIDESIVVKTEKMEGDEYERDSINVSIKTEIISEDEYDSDCEYDDDINIKSECPDYEDEYDEQYYEEEDPNVSYTFRRNETGVKNEERRWNEKPDDEDVFDVPYSFVSKNQILSENNKDITLPKTDEINEGGSDREDQRWNNLSDDDNDDDGGAVYNFKVLNEQKKSEKQTKGVDQHGQKYLKEEIQN